MTSKDTVSYTHLDVYKRQLLNDLSKKLLAQEVDRSKAIIVDVTGDGLSFRN